MINILYTSSSEYCLAPIAEHLTEKYNKNFGFELNIESSIIGGISKLNKSSREYLKKNNIQNHPDINSYKKITDILIEIKIDDNTPPSVFVPGYPTTLIWNLSSNSLKNQDSEIIFENIENKINEQIETLLEYNYLSSLFTATKKTRFILNSLKNGIIAHDLNRRIAYFNKAAEDITGYSKEEVLGKDCHDVFPGNFCGCKCSFQENNENLTDNLDSNYYINFTSKDGIHKKLEMNLNTIKNNKDEPYGILAAFEDKSLEFDMANKLGKIESFEGIIGKDPKMQEVFNLIKTVSDSNVPVVISGASGTGKELVAKAIHNESPRANKPFITVNCGALPEGLLETELFGHLKGAFTGAVKNKKGKFELADGGTIFLDEIGEISQAMQIKLLRVLQEGTFEKLGSETTIKVDIRVISATNKNLNEEINKGNFREDLYYRLCVMPINLPPLKERRGDIPYIADYLLRRELNNHNKDLALSQKSIELLCNYEWPGNIRELQNWLQFAILKCSDKQLIHPIPFPIYNKSIKANKNYKKKLSSNTIKEALNKTEGNKAKAAKLLGIGRATLYRYLKSYNL